MNPLFSAYAWYRRQSRPVQIAMALAVLALLLLGGRSAGLDVFDRPELDLR